MDQSAAIWWIKRQHRLSFWCRRIKTAQAQLCQ